MKLFSCTLLVVLPFLSSCHDSYRYTCQDPAHFNDAECQKPLCEFNQTCPEYLVAPVLEKKIEGITPSVSQQPQGSVNCR